MLQCSHILETSSLVCPGAPKHAGLNLSDVIAPVSSAGEGLKLALQARSYRQEVILLVADRKRIDGFLQGARSLHSLGLEHILLLSLTESECKVVNAAVPEIGCGWTTFQSPDDLEGVYDMWNLRYRTVARFGSCTSAIFMMLQSREAALHVGSYT